MNNACNYFSSIKDMYVFALTELGGKPRNDMIGLSESVYCDISIAHEWYSNIMNILTDADVEHKCDEINVNKAICKLTDIYCNIVYYCRGV